MIFIDGIVYSLQDAGGISVYFSEVIAKLEKNHQNCFIVYMLGNSNKIVKEYNQEKYISNCNARIPIAYARYFDIDLPEGVSVFHSTYYRLPKRDIRSSVKVVTTVHDFTYEMWVSGLKKHIHHWQKKRAILNSDVVVCISENTKRDLLKYIPEAINKDIRVIYNGVSDDFRPLESNQHFFVDNYVLFVGARSGYKNFSSAVHALTNINDLKLVIVGGGALTEYERNFLEHTLHGRFEHRSFVSNEELNYLYNNALCLVYPSLYEGFGIPAIEAMKSGCPVIASNTSSLPEICGNAAILIDDISVQTIQFSIEKLFNDQYRAELIQYGYKNAERFSWDRTFESLKEIYFG